MILGIDPGQSGGMAIIHPDRLEIVDGTRVPTTKAKCKVVLNTAAARDFLAPYNCGVAIIEQVGTMPGQGIVSAFSFGRITGALEAVAGMEALDTHWVTPAVWKRHYGLSRDKQASIDTARKLFGSSYRWQYKADEGIAEAALIGLYYRQRHMHLGMTP